MGTYFPLNSGGITRERLKRFVAADYTENLYSRKEVLPKQLRGICCSKENPNEAIGLPMNDICIFMHARILVGEIV